MCAYVTPIYQLSCQEFERIQDKSTSRQVIQCTFCSFCFSPPRSSVFGNQKESHFAKHHFQEKTRGKTKKRDKFNQNLARVCTLLFCCYSSYIRSIVCTIGIIHKLCGPGWWRGPPLLRPPPSRST